MNGVPPTFEAIADGKYPVSRPLYFYVKKAHVGVIPGMEQYVAEFVSEKASGTEGYLSDRGLIPMPPKERAKFRNDAQRLAELKL
jgi:phosphate transport system substrate-binding protein